jgi:diphthine synthase
MGPERAPFYQKMTFYLIGLGLNEDSLSLEARKVLENCEKVYLESYTVDFPYKKEDLEKSLSIVVESIGREKVEDESLSGQAKNKNIALLVYGDPFSATTHLQLILSCKKQKISFKIFHNASIINSVAETGLSIYKFGKISSMPAWSKGYRPASFIDYLQENKKIDAHSLLLVDIGLNFENALNQLNLASRERIFPIKKILVLSSMGTKNQKVYYDSILNLRKIKCVDKPFCFIIPSRMHFLEREALELFY